MPLANLSNINLEHVIDVLVSCLTNKTSKNLIFRSLINIALKAVKELLPLN